MLPKSGTPNIVLNFLKEYNLYSIFLIPRQILKILLIPVKSIVTDLFFGIQQSIYFFSLNSYISRSSFIKYFFGHWLFRGLPVFQCTGFKFGSKNLRESDNAISRTFELPCRKDLPWNVSSTTRSDFCRLFSSRIWRSCHTVFDSICYAPENVLMRSW